MQDALLLAVVAVTFAFGWLLMGKLDCFLEANSYGQELQPASDEYTLQLGFCNPMAVDSITDVLDHYFKLHPNISVRVFCGSEGELLKSFSVGKIDVIFLPENAEIPAHMHYKVVSLNYAPVTMKYGGLAIEPIADGHVIQNALWIGEAASDCASCFMKCLEEKFAVSAQAK